MKIVEIEVEASKSHIEELSFFSALIGDLHSESLIASTQFNELANIALHNIVGPNLFYAFFYYFIARGVTSSTSPLPESTWHRITTVVGNFKGYASYSKLTVIAVSLFSRDKLETKDGESRCSIALSRPPSADVDRTAWNILLKLRSVTWEADLERAKAKAVEIELAVRMKNMACTAQ